MRTRFESIGAYTPGTVRSTEDVIASLSIPRALDLERITGIKNRRVHNSDPDDYESSFELALRAIDDCLTHSDYAAEDLDVIINVSITRFRGPEYFCYAPSFALMLRNALGAKQARYFDLSNACAGMITGVLLLDRMIKAGVVRNGLVVSGEQITPIADTAAREISQPYDPQFAALTVGDAAVAVVVDGRGDDHDEIHYIELMTTSAGAEHCLGMPSEKTTGIAMYTDNRALASESRFQQGISRMDDFLTETGRTWESEKYDYWVHHQFSGPAIEYISQLTERHFDTPMPQPLNVYDEFGNTASTSHFLVLHEHLARQRIPKGSKVLLIPEASGVVSGHLAATITRLEA
ncbi:3-oxoacyl-ACP synthase III family protein [Nocardia otitidiscaviarum]|uniref:3-oxoacyl-ACP synthase n=1 Tax=Nocardia otitidiscaviarum TaxID=1823 RepID=A0A516NHY3_9NOCA|nr:3-oxoacyl-[acyl-carrier-protein] synthase III C-terminal domain-containing protein [Nocardia otitidiscaviarum]MBF6177357.1 3-oxoacyl-ACP synthase [Nocardia otitidiscaviarum]MBF6236537.1 3-oxoacyl-ACP synthase [Nocardia otitidiscaviarum]MCP9620002.1 3-oxoacyl-ACP synthase [Nocardia otitidiscaviarum]QDP78528.1 3-oxoacyl-ACP synthase [Nocardia otitidiscaviarum]